jgi:glycyl-tRNA synthetase
MPLEPEQNLSEKVVNLCLRRAFLFPTSEAYGTFAGFFDYGPLGAEMKRALEASWWRRFVRERRDVVGLDGSILTNPKVWKASGHADAFNDPLVECTKCHKRYRADHLVEGALKISVDGLPLERVQELAKKHKVVCPDDKGELTPIKKFNLMFRTFVGATEDENSQAYLRPETAQLIFANFPRLALAARKPLPFGVAQIGKAFRNEISPRNFVFRAREFTQMEIEFFVHPKRLDDCPLFDAVARQKAQLLTQELQAKGEHEKSVEMSFGDAVAKKIMGTRWHAYWLAESLRFFTDLGIRAENLRLRQHTKDELSHYSSETWDVEYRYPWGWKELAGIANRSDFDLRQHAKHSGKDLSFLDPATQEKVVPHVIEPSFGLDRAFFTLLLDAFTEKREKDGTRIVLALSPRVAPLKAAVFPLVKKGGLSERASELHREIQARVSGLVAYDEDGSIGRRYARVDEAGCPFAVTVDFQTLEDGTATVRERDSGVQKRVPVKELPALLEDLRAGRKSFAQP